MLLNLGKVFAHSSKRGGAKNGEGGEEEEMKVEDDENEEDYENDEDEKKEGDEMNTKLQTAQTKKEKRIIIIGTKKKSRGKKARGNEGKDLVWF